MILVDPVFHRLYHKAAHHGLFGSSLITAAGAVGVDPLILVLYLTVNRPKFRATRMSTLFCLSEIIVGKSALEITPFDVEGVVIDYIKDDTDARLMKSHHHLLELTDAAERVFGIC